MKHQSKSLGKARQGNWRTAELVYLFGRGMSLSIHVDSVEVITSRPKNVNFPLKRAPRDPWYRREEILVGERQILVRDPDGYLLRFQQPLGEKPSPEIQGTLEGHS